MTAPGRRRIALLTWASAFMVVHVAWALGWTGGLGPDAEGKVSGWFLAYDVAAAVGCAVAAWWAWTGWRRGLLLVAAAVTVRAGLGVAQVVVLLVTGGDVVTSTSWVEAYFVVGAVLCLGALREARA